MRAQSGNVKSTSSSKTRVIEKESTFRKSGRPSSLMDEDGKEELKNLPGIQRVQVVPPIANSLVQQPVSKQNVIKKSISSHHTQLRNVSQLRPRGNMTPQ